MFNKVFFYILFASVPFSFGQKFPNLSKLSTGQGVAGGLDPVWLVSQWYSINPPNPNSLTYSPALINNNCAPGAWVTPSSLPTPINNGNWITGTNTPCNNNTNDGYLYFRLPLDLPSDCNGNSILINGNYTLYLSGYVDNQITDVFVNGISQGITGGGYSPGGQLNMVIPGPWVIGVNHIDIQVYNYPNGGQGNPYGLLLVANYNASMNSDMDKDGISDLNDNCPCQPGAFPDGCCTTPSTPIGQSIQTFCNPATIADLIMSGSNIKWYQTNSDVNPLSTSTSLVNNSTYYASQTINGCESNKLPVQVNIFSKPTFNSISSVCSGTLLSPLPINSLEGIIGTWTPALNNTKTTTYTFTPSPTFCASNTTTMTITVNPTPITPIGNSIQTFCNPATIADLIISGSNIKWYQTNSDVNPLSTSTSLVNNSTYYASQTINGCESNKLPVQVNIFSKPTFNSISSVCSGTLLSPLPINSLEGIIGTWTPALNNTKTTTYTFTPSPTFCASNTTTMTITVNPTPTAYATPASETICSGKSSSINLTSDIVGTTFTWIEKPNGTSGGSAGVGSTIYQTLSTLTGGFEKYTITPQLNSCIGKTVDVIVTVVLNPVVSVTPSQTVGCVPVKVEFKNQTIGASTYQWYFGDGKTSNLFDPIHIYNEAGCYDVTLVASSSNGCVSKMVYPSLECFELAPIASLVADPTRISNQNPVSKLINNSINASSYSWDFNDGTPLSSESALTHTFPSDVITKYQVTLVAYNHLGCSDTAITIINIFEDLVYFIPNTFTPNEDSHNDTFKPVFVSGYDPYEFTMLIFDRWGEVLFESHDATVGWSGRYGKDNAIVKEGTYSWTIDFKISNTVLRKKIQGHVNLLK